MSHRSNISITLDTAVTGGVHAGRSNDLIPKIMISSIVILFSIVLLILILHFYVRWHVLRRATRRARRLRRMIFAGDGQSPAASHAVDPAVLKSLPVLLFSGDGDLRECSVCLNEFEEGEKIRHLPRCGHSFHIDCIDMWFSSHSSCPLCRAAVEAVSSSADSPAAIDLCSSCQREESIGSLETDSGSGEVVIDIPAGLIEGNGGEEEGLGFGRRHNAIWKSSRVLCLIWRSLTLNIWRKRVDGVVTDPELDGGETVLPPPATSPLSPTL